MALPIKVLVADDAELMRRAIRFLLRQRDEIRGVGEASNLQEAAQIAAQLNPDVVVIDLNMANRDGVPLSEVKSLLNGARILAISFGGDDSTTELAYRSGAVKLLDKMNLSEELIPTILEIASRVGDGTKFEGKPN